MKHIAFLLLLFPSILFAQKKDLAKSTLIIPPQQVVTVDYPYYKGFRVKVWNKAKFEVGVSARNKETDSLQKGFGLNKGASASLSVEEDMYLQFENRFFAPLKVEYTIFKGKPGKKKVGELTPQRGFYLVNTTAQAIPLKIPGVMNPNLSPFSKSGVDLPIGQKILLSVAGKDLLLLTVSDSIPKGAQVNVADLIDRALNKE
jgi:hypothetical protein